MYTNPIVPGFYPDPSVCRVGIDYYLVNSSFEFFPGVPIFHSKDLINWRQIGHCLTRPSQLPLDKKAFSMGIFAPTIRHHNGTFYMTTTNTGIDGKGHFLVTATNPAGPWSEPVWIDNNGIDPSMFFDDDGMVYYQSTSDIGIRQFVIDPNTGKHLSEDKVLWNGTGGRYPEGPHMYKRNSYYYVVLAEGGTEYGHMVTIARGKSIWGPFEPCPHNPILSHRNHGGHPIQGTGHADLFEAHDGSWWIVFLGFRSISGAFHHLGRETFIAPVEWNSDGWPIVNQGKPIELKMDIPTLPLNLVPSKPTRVDFNGNHLGLEWNYLRNPNMTNYSLTKKSGWLSLVGTSISLDMEDTPTFCARRQQHFCCDVRTSIEFSPENTGEEAGLSIYMNHEHHYEIGIRKLSGNKREVFVRQRIGLLSAITALHEIANGPVVLTISAKHLDYCFSVVHGKNNDVVELGSARTQYLSSEVAKGFTGVYVGMYAQTSIEGAMTTPAAFKWFEYLSKE